MSFCNPDGHFEKITPSREVQEYPRIVALTQVDFAQLVVESVDLCEALVHAERGVAVADIHRVLVECESIAQASGLTALRACDRLYSQTEQTRPRHF